MHVTDRNGNLYELRAAPFRHQKRLTLPSQFGAACSAGAIHGKKFRFRQQHTTSTYQKNFENEINNIVRETQRELNEGRKFMLSFGMPSADATAAPQTTDPHSLC